MTFSSLGQRMILYHILMTYRERKITRQSKNKIGANSTAPNAIDHCHPNLMRKLFANEYH